MYSKLLSQEHAGLLSLLIKIIDLVIYFCCAFFTYRLLFGTFTLNLHYQIAILVSLFLLNPVFSIFGVYQSLRGVDLIHYLKPLLSAVIVLMIALAFISFISKTGTYYSRAWFLYYNFFALIFFISTRILIRYFLHSVRKRGKNLKRIIIIGESSITEDIITKVSQASWIGYEIYNVTLHTIPENISDYIEKNNIFEIWITGALSNSETEKIINQLNENVVTIRLFPNIKTGLLLNHTVTEMLGFPVINIVASPITGVNKIYKRIEDVVLSSIILILISPLFLLISLLIKLTSKGPIFYKQERVGWNGNKFNMLKFRSMPIDAESTTGAIWATPQDKRATRLGTFLRKTSLDELPQFLNVLAGEMSIVGPRPERPIFVEKFKKEIPDYMSKHLVKGGITGWAQINGWRGSTCLRKRIEYDLYYINNWSLGFDLKIILLTICKGFINKNAY